MSWDCHSLSIHFLCHSPVSHDSSLVSHFSALLIIDPSVFSYPRPKQKALVTIVYSKSPNPWCVVRKKKQERWRYVSTESSTANWVVVSNIFYVHPYLRKIPILTSIFQRGWNHQLAKFSVCLARWFPSFCWSHGRPWPLNRAGEVIASRSRAFGFFVPWVLMGRDAAESHTKWKVVFVFHFVRFIAWIYTKNRYYIQICWFFFDK